MSDDYHTKIYSRLFFFFLFLNCAIHLNLPSEKNLNKSKQKKYQKTKTTRALKSHVAYLALKEIFKFKFESKCAVASISTTFSIYHWYDSCVNKTGWESISWREKFWPIRKADTRRTAFHRFHAYSSANWFWWIVLLILQASPQFKGNVSVLRTLITSTSHL